MEMIVDGKNTLQEIQDKFNKQFPFLRIEFFNADKSKGANFSKENLISDTSKALVDVGIIFKTSSVSLDGRQKVSTLEKHFIDTFGIYIQIFRKSGNSWLQTTATDEWTLTQQNNKGEEMSRDIEQVEEENDIHEQP